MIHQLARVLLTSSAAVLLIGAVLHTRAFGKARAAVSTSNLPDFFANALRALWLIDSATMVALALVFLQVALRPVTGVVPLVLLLALIPAATAGLMYRFLGRSFPTAHLLAVATILTLVAGALLARP